MRAIKVKLIYEPVTTYIVSYTCPSCNRTIIGAGISEEVTRFKCHKCKRELIVEEILFKEKRK